MSVPGVELVTKDRSESPLPVRDLKDRVIADTPVPSVNSGQVHDSLDGTEKGVLGRREWDFVDVRTILIIFAFRDRDDDALTDVVVQRGDIFPAEDKL